MEDNTRIDFNSKTPYYKQLIESIQQQIKNGNLKEGDYLPSMNDLSVALSISKETIKKAYYILREKGIIGAIQGKGFYITTPDSSDKIKALMIFDKLSNYKLVLYRSFMKHVGDAAEITIHLHNQDVTVFENLLEENLDKYDYYLITPHFPLDTTNQNKVLKLLQKIPNRKLILLDKRIPVLSGNYGAIYQNLEEDSYEGLLQGKRLLRKYKTIHVFSSPNSLYAHITQKGIRKFCEEYRKKCILHTSIGENDIIPGDLYVILNSQLDDEVIDFIRGVRTLKLKTGKNIGIISYNESPVNEIIMNGLTVLSTDFNEMGKLAAEMMLSGNLKKIKNKFDLIVRKSI